MIERLRALEKKWKGLVDYAAYDKWDEGYISAMNSAADDLSRLIAELGQEVGAVESVWMYRRAGSTDTWSPFVNEKHRLNTMQSHEWEVREFTSPAHTSGAMDALKWNVLCDRIDKASDADWKVMLDILGDARAMGAGALELHINEMIKDAAMRQEAE